MAYVDKVVNCEEQADEFIANYYREYHPAGYGTTCRKETLPDGRVKVICTRYDSCD